MPAVQDVIQGKNAEEEEDKALCEEEPRTPARVDSAPGQYRENFTQGTQTEKQHTTQGCLDARLCRKVSCPVFICVF